ncbi:hypothetical protein DY000_02048407 [Brassica cretica]|uniref:Gamma-tubulin complex component n=1 Tax=Brassica cretica TaxID=69181 RepID=A0ABQ7F5F8_BRACR|nr:hypothetical protein DY000_02048407 [Brassica cretica]
MTVATSLDSLLEKLKVEELYVPPSNWESLHSQSRQFPPPTRASPPSSSSVSESSLVRLALNALQGVESSLISIHKLSSVLCSEPANRTTHQIPSLWHRVSRTDALGQIRRNIGCFGSVVFLLHNFVDPFQELQDFAIAVKKFLEGYISGLDTLCASAELRHSSNIVVYTSAFWITGLLILDNKRFSNVRKYVAAMIQQPRVPSSGLMPASDVLIRAKEVITSRDILVGLLSKHTGNTVANVMRSHITWMHQKLKSLESLTG